MRSHNANAARAKLEKIEIGRSKFLDLVQNTNHINGDIDS